MTIKTGCVIPCYKGGETTLTLLEKTLKYVDVIVVVDDKCPFQTGLKIEQKYQQNSSIFVAYNEINSGVGGATKRGIDILMNAGCEVIIKIDADGQINPHLIPKIINMRLPKGIALLA